LKSKCLTYRKEEIPNYDTTYLEFAFAVHITFSPLLYLS